MPKRELREPGQVEAWLEAWGSAVKHPCSLILIGSAGLLWHAHQKGISAPLPDNSMDVDPVTDDEEVALLAYDAMIGSDFELQHGWHVNLMPAAVLRELPAGWEARTAEKIYALLRVKVPAVADLLAPKLRRGEPRDHAHSQWAYRVGIAPHPAGDEIPPAG
jgi:hypothetical protein